MIPLKTYIVSIGCSFQLSNHQLDAIRFTKSGGKKPQKKKTYWTDYLNKQTNKLSSTEANPFNFCRSSMRPDEGGGESYLGPSLVYVFMTILAFVASE